MLGKSLVHRGVEHKVARHLRISFTHLFACLLCWIDGEDVDAEILAHGGQLI